MTAENSWTHGEINLLDKKSLPLPLVRLQIRAVFTVATALTRLTSGTVNVFGNASYSAAQQLQRINEVLDYFYDQGTWRGVQDVLPLTTTSGVLTLSSAYQRLDGLGVPAYHQYVPIKPKDWAFSTNGPHVMDWTQFPSLVAIDMGDNASGQRQYQLTGGLTQLDALAFTGLLRKRFTWITSTSTVVSPDSYEALRKGVLAFRAADNQDWDNEARLKADALQLLNGSLQEFENEELIMQVSHSIGTRTAMIH